MTNEKRCEICDRGDCRREEMAQDLTRFMKNVDEGRVKAAVNMIEGTKDVLREAAAEARRDCERHTVDWEEKYRAAERLRNASNEDNDRLRQERIKLRQKLVQGGYEHPDHDFVKTFGRAVQDAANLRTEISRLREEYRSSGPQVVEIAKERDEAQKEVRELHVKVNSLKADLDSAKTERTIYKDKLERRQRHAERPVEWQRTVEDIARLASLYTHDMALPTSTSGEVALGRAAEYLCELLREGMEILETISGNYALQNQVGGRAVALEGWVRRWLERTKMSPLAAVPQEVASLAAPRCSTCGDIFAYGYGPRCSCEGKAQ